MTLTLVFKWTRSNAIMLRTVPLSQAPADLPRHGGSSETEHPNLGLRRHLTMQKGRARTVRFRAFRVHQKHGLPETVMAAVVVNCGVAPPPPSPASFPVRWSPLMCFVGRSWPDCGARSWCYLANSCVSPIKNI